jgi:hypothetical protein
VTHEETQAETLSVSLAFQSAAARVLLLEKHYKARRVFCQEVFVKILGAIFGYAANAFLAIMPWQQEKSARRADARAFF